MYMRDIHIFQSRLYFAQKYAAYQTPEVSLLKWCLNAGSSPLAERDAAEEVQSRLLSVSKQFLEITAAQSSHKKDDTDESDIPVAYIPPDRQEWDQVCLLTTPLNKIIPLSCSITLADCRRHRGLPIHLKLPSCCTFCLECNAVPDIISFRNKLARLDCL